MSASTTLRRRSHSTMSLMTVSDQVLTNRDSSCRRYKIDPFYKRQVDFLRTMDSKVAQKDHLPGPFEREVMEKASVNLQAKVECLKRYQIQKRVKRDMLLEGLRDMLIKSIFPE